ncbi:MAG: HAD-IA family hydrolase [Endomicrobium sp.]|jgi:phosphoglycolate phosphatase|nr:HAD-IA family hydrolase [Endomicrobium sp.]
MSYDFLIFDLDGTLVDSQNDLTNVVNLIRADYGLKPLTVEQVKACLGSGVNTLMEQIVPLKQVNNQDLVKKFSFYYDKHLTDFTVLYDGVKEMLDILKSKKKAILSNKPQNFCKKIAFRLAIADYFVKIWGGDTLEVKKPDPKTIFSLVEATNSDIKKTVMIGDSANDFLVSKRAGIDSIAVSYGYATKEQTDFYKPTFIVNSFKDLINIIL